MPVPIAPTNLASPGISHLAGFVTSDPARPSLLPPLPMTLLDSTLLPHPLRVSDNDLIRAHWHHPDAYKDKVGVYYIDTVWQCYLSNRTYARSFQPLEGTERERYQCTIDKEHKGDVARVNQEDTLLRDFVAAAEEIKDLREKLPSSSQTPAQAQVASPSIPVKRKRGRPRKHPRPEDNQDASTQPAPQDAQNKHESIDPRAEAATRQASRQYAESAKLVQAGIKQLDHHIKHVRKPLRHERQYPGLDRWSIDCHYGPIRGHPRLLREHWFMGHRPGDPIMRIVDAPRTHPIFGLDYLFVHPVFDSQDFDMTHLYCRFRFEGIVPFNYAESQQRMADHAFPAFMTMIIAALGFNPERPDAELPPQLKRVWAILQQDMQDMDLSTKDELVQLMDTLPRIWMIKYGTDASKLPRFLQVQFEKSKSRLGEMAWLLHHTISGVPGYYVLRHFTDRFLQVMVGAGVVAMADWYFHYQLSPEAEGQMEEGDIENIFLYRSDSAIEMHLPVLTSTYDRDGSYPRLSTERLEELQALAREFVPQLFVVALRRPEDPVFRYSVPVTAEELKRILAGRSKERRTATVDNRDDENEDEVGKSCITVATSSQPKKKETTEARILPSPPTSSPTKTAGKPTGEAYEEEEST